MDPRLNEFNHFNYFDNKEIQYVEEELQTQMHAAPPRLGK